MAQRNKTHQTLDTQTISIECVVSSGLFMGFTDGILIDTSVRSWLITIFVHN